MTYFRTSVTAVYRRRYGSAGPAWLVMVHIDGLKSSGFGEPSTALPMADAVVDDFGQLVLVSPWR